VREREREHPDTEERERAREAQRIQGAASLPTFTRREGKEREGGREGGREEIERESRENTQITEKERAQRLTASANGTTPRKGGRS